MQSKSKAKKEAKVAADKHSVEGVGAEYVAEKGKFRLQNKRLFLTYRGHLVKNEVEEMFRETFSSYDIIFFRVAHESGNPDKHDGIAYEHTHILLEFDRAFQSRDCRVFDIDDVHPNIRKINGGKHWANAARYLAKEDQENLDLLELFPKEAGGIDWESFWACKTKKEAIEKFAKGFSDVPGLVAAHQIGHRRKLTRFHFDADRYEWQRNIIALNDIVPDDRTIFWYYDERGHRGKTKLTKYLGINYPGKWLVGSDMGTMRDAATTISGALDKGWEGWGIIINLSRCVEGDRRRVYEYLEPIKDGLITTQKYMGGTEIYDVPHMIIMANWLPDVSRMSLDRWKIMKVVNGDKVEQLDTFELLKQRKREELGDDYDSEEVEAMYNYDSDQEGLSYERVQELYEAGLREAEYDQWCQDQMRLQMDIEKKETDEEDEADYQLWLERNKDFVP